MAVIGSGPSFRRSVLLLLLAATVVNWMVWSHFTVTARRRGTLLMLAAVGGRGVHTLHPTSPPAARPSTVPLDSTPESTTRKPRAILHTEFGGLTFELQPQAAPKSVENFLRNARYGYLNKSACFYRYEKGFVLQGGCCGTHKCGPNVPLEYSLPNVKYSVALARRGGDLDSGGSEWFINLANNTRSLGPQKKGGYAVFAHVVDGFDTLDALKHLAVRKTGALTKFVSSPSIKRVDIID